MYPSHFCRSRSGAGRRRNIHSYWKCFLRTCSTASGWRIWRTCRSYRNGNCRYHGPVYITGAPKTFVLKFCIGLIVGLVAHKVAKINESTDKKYVFKWSVIASIAGLAFNVIADPIVGYFYKQYILGQPQELAQHLQK